MLSGIASGDARERARRSGATILASVLAHALLAALLIATVKQVRAARTPDPTVEPIEVRFIQPVHQPPLPAGLPHAQRAPPRQPGSKSLQPVSRRKLELKKPTEVALAPALAPKSQPLAENRPVIAAPAAPLAGDGAADGGAPAGVADGAPGGARGDAPGDGDAEPLTAPSYDAAYLRNPPPPYPAAARRLKLQGTTTLRVLVGADGRPQTVSIENSSGVAILDEAARGAVQRWSFVPARQGTKPVAAEVDVPVRFRLGEASEQLP